MCRIRSARLRRRRSLVPARWLPVILLALSRLVPFSYFCTCWNVRPSVAELYLTYAQHHVAQPHPTANVLVDGIGCFSPW